MSGMPVSRGLRYNSAATPPGPGACDNFCCECLFRDTMNTTKGGGFMKFSNLVRLAVGVSFLLFGAYTLASPPAVNYHLLKKVQLAAAPGGGAYFDYITVDPAALDSTWLSAPVAERDNRRTRGRYPIRNL